jgi:hypothetical protein
MNKMKFLLLFIAYIFASGCLSRKSTLKNYQYEIIIDKNAISSVKLAAAEMKHYLEILTKDEVEILNSPNDGVHKSIYIGESDALNKIFKIKPSLEFDSYLIKSHGQNALILIGNDTQFQRNFDFARSYEDIPRANKIWQQVSQTKTRSPIHGLYKAYNRKYDLWEYDSKGSLYAVYDFLRQQGIEWYMFSSEGEVIPDHPVLKWPTGERIVKPDFKLRWHYRYGESFSQATDDELLWYLRLGLNRNPEVLGLGEPGHGLQNVVADPFIKRVHSEFFALFNGKRDNDIDKNGQVCLSSTGLKQLTIDYARSFFDYYNIDVLSIMPPDGFTHICQCSLCEGKSTAERGNEGKLSDYVWNFVNDVAKEVYKSHPNKRLTCFAYGYSLLPPTNLKDLSPNIQVGVCRTRSEFQNEETLEKYKNIENSWRAITSLPLFTYDYYLYTRPLRSLHNVPVFIPDLISNDLQYLKHNKTIGEFIEVFTNYNNKQGDIIEVLNHLNVYITARLYWDTSLSIKDMLSKYYKLMYPEASDEVEQLYSFLNQNWYYLKEDFSKFNKATVLLNSAISKTKDQAAKRRLQLIKNYISPLQVSKMISILDDPKQREIRVINCKSSIKIDGKLMDQAWKDPFDFRMANPENVNRKIETSRVQFTWCNGEFNIGARLRDSDMKGLRKKSNSQASLTMNDHLMIELKTLNGDELKFIVGVSGEIDIISKPRNYSEKIEAAVSVNDNDWTVEMRIPINKGDLFSNDFGLKGHIPTDDYPWFFNIQRVYYSDGSKSIMNFANYTSGEKVLNPLSKIYFRGY